MERILPAQTLHTSQCANVEVSPVRGGRTDMQPSGWGTPGPPLKRKLHVYISFIEKKTYKTLTKNNYLFFFHPSVSSSFSYKVVSYSGIKNDQ